MKLSLIPNFDLIIILKLSERPHAVCSCQVTGNITVLYRVYCDGLPNFRIMSESHLKQKYVMNVVYCNSLTHFLHILHSTVLAPYTVTSNTTFKTNTKPVSADFCTKLITQFLVHAPRTFRYKSSHCNCMMLSHLKTPFTVNTVSCLL
jgi:hypothetical protein